MTVPDDVDDLGGLDALAQPACPECGTALRDIRRGYRCPACALVFLPDLSPHTAGDDAQLMRPTSTDTVAPAGS
ncbi:zf-TFIIB domain-containing protein [Microbacterium sp. ET2]|uniref:TFIIB-type zinc ribbon-containing protein n=1 Tax=Microbacterium albipurpureum TaxID=3050384 RepID=UPI00259C804B|nr:zf-TFIIB domain-containing protein [Microbacterium sp. ET2 (Ac-2212)]WJL94624.1 zf-TFIIB domain-containing protein [Microbacterium sp. ET2 (Ac-2212)]